MGIVLCFITCSSHVVADTANGHCLSCYMLSVNLLLIHILPKSFVHWYDAFHSLSIACNSMFKSFDGEAWSLWILCKFSYCIWSQNPQSIRCQRSVVAVEGKATAVWGDSKRWYCSTHLWTLKIKSGFLKGPTSVLWIWCIYLDFRGHGLLLFVRLFFLPKTTRFGRSPCTYFFNCWVVPAPCGLALEFASSHLLWANKPKGSPVLLGFCIYSKVPGIAKGFRVWFVAVLKT